MNTPSIQPLKEHADYKAAQQKLNEIQAVLGRTVERLTELEIKLAQRPEKLDAVAVSDRILASEDASTPSAEWVGMQIEHLQLRERRDILSAGARQQQQAIEALAARLSVEASRQLAPQGKAIAQRMADLLRQFDALQAESAGLVRQLGRLGFDNHPHHLPLLLWHYVGTLQTLPEQSPLSVQIKELEAYARS